MEVDVKPNPHLFQMYPLSDEEIRARFRKGHPDYIPEKEMVCFLMNFNGYSHQDIYRETDISPTTANTYIQKVRDKLHLTRISSVYYTAIVREIIIPHFVFVANNKEQFYPYIGNIPLETFTITDAVTGETIRLWKPPTIDEMDAPRAVQFIVVIIAIVVGVIVVTLALVTLPLFLTP